VHGQLGKRVGGLEPLTAPHWFTHGVFGRFLEQLKLRWRPRSEGQWRHLDKRLIIPAFSFSQKSGRINYVRTFAMSSLTARFLTMSVKWCDDDDNDRYQQYNVTW
jgi:hypothetical protein